jgi:LAS superfamily LD-carboxypeptidase LdcB
MRVIRPEDFKRLPKKRNNKKRNMVLYGLAIFATGIYLTKNLTNGSMPDDKPHSDQVSAVASVSDEVMKQFSSEDFQVLAANVRYPNVQPFSEPPPISGNSAADARIRSIAESRGYKLTVVPAGSIQKIDEPRLEGDDLLQPLAAIAWQELKISAAKENVRLSLISAYRSPEYQRKLFMQRLLGRNVTVEQIAAGQADSAVESTLQMTAVPGYSRHHTGYTVDLWCEDGSGTFESSKCYKWIKADNFRHAKEAGWIPSYPDGVTDQGPEPEPWEYVWIGKEYLNK